RTPAPVPEVTGRTLFQQYRCHTCHDGGFQRGPSLVGIADAEIPLADGRTVVADDNYLRESILEPAAKVVAGFEPLMPTYRGQISEEEILALINYIRSLETVE